VNATIPPPCGSKSALFLDLDGTLLEIAATPGEVLVSERLLHVLASLREGLDRAVALVSGRSIAEIDRLIGLPGLAVAGIHGGERRDASGRLHRLPADPRIDDARRALAAFAMRHPGLLLEDKGTALALHFRQAPGMEPAARAVVADALAASGAAFEVQAGKRVLEIKPAGASKGRAIELYMAEPPFAGRVPVFIGDDLTDEPGFEVVNRMNGYSVRVGAADWSRAQWSLPDVPRVLDWLESGCGPG
jgi:trehalose 6-phosphate phosphatase